MINFYKKNLLLAFFVLAGSAFLASPPNGPLPCLGKKFSIIAHIVRDSLGDPGVLEAEILTSLIELNGYFDPIGVSFEVCEFRYIDNFQYNKLDTINEWSQVQIKYHEANRINIFYVNETIPGGSFASLNGITQLNSGGLCIIKNNLLSISHNMGHYFGLLDTYEGSGTELVDGSNCGTEGDLVCDTPADPYSASISVNEYVDGCRFISLVKDANGAYYTPDVGNIMSGYLLECKCEFTHDQYIRMVNTYSLNPKMW